MNKIFYQLLIVALISCGNSNTGKESTKEKMVSTQSPDASTPTLTPGDDLIGDWKLTMETYDDNDNKQLDDAERKKAFSNHYFFRFSADGSCLINTFPNAKGAFKGHYVREKQNGKEKISVFIDETGGKSESNGSYWVISVNKEELVLLDGEAEHAFWILKRA